MDITLTWDSSVLSMPTAEQAQFEAAVTYAADYFDRVLTSNVAITINVGWGEYTYQGVSTPLADQFSFGSPIFYSYNYSQVLTALQSNENSPETISAYSALPTNDPSDGGGIYLAPDQAAALGLPVFGSSLGFVGFGVQSDYDFSSSDRAVPGEGDFIGIAEHEISHALARVIFSSSPLPLLDLFRFSAPGVLAGNNASSAYFSIDGGVTPLKYFATTSDVADWATSGANASQGDSFDGVWTPGVVNYVSSADLDVLNLLGFTVTQSLPGYDLNGDQLSDLLIENGVGAVVVGTVVDGQASYAQVAGLGTEWRFQGVGDFLGDRQSDFLIENTSGVVVLGEVVNGQATYISVAALGPEWKFVGTGDFLGDGKSDFLIENTSGVVVAGEVKNGNTTYTVVAGLGSEWSFRGAGNFLADGKADFLIQNSVGAVVIGEVANGSATYTNVVGLGPEWKFVGTGDFMGEGHDQFLIENASGAVDVGDYAGGQIHFTQVIGLGPEWKFVGAGDYLGEGHDQFLIENTAGAVFVGDWSDGQIHYTQVAALGSEWAFH